MRAGASGPLLRRGHLGGAHGRPPPLRDHRARAVDGGRQAERRLPPGAPGPGGARHRPGRRRLGLGGRVLLHHLPAAARPRAGHGAHDAAPPRALGRARARRPRPGRRRPGRRGVRAGRRPRHGRPSATPASSRCGYRNPSAASASRRTCRPASTSASWRWSTSASTRPASPSQTLPPPGDTGRAPRLVPLRRRAGTRSALAPLLGRRHTARHPDDRFDRVGAHLADVHLRAVLAGAGLARRSA